MGARGFEVIVALALMAGCGGKTGDDGSGVGGSGVGGSGVGGVGGGGVGGAGAMGGSATGGSGNLGGGGGPIGGSAGVGGGPIADGIVKLCDQIESLPCAPADCEGQLYDSWGDAYSQGCEKFFAAAIDCLLTHPVVCAGGEIQIPPECESIVDTLQSCVQPPSACSGSVGPGTCGIQCEGWSATCNDHMGELSCQCTSGPFVGQAFTLPGSCYTTSLDQAQGWCAGG